jgi:hypothetical protein
MTPGNPVHDRDIDPTCVDVAMKLLPEMYRTGVLAGNEEFVYASTFFAVGEELKRGAAAEAIREQTSRILRYVDESDRSAYDKEQFAALFARAVDDALEGWPPCVLH